MGRQILWDCHMHSSFSADSDTPMEVMIHRAVETGLQGITFTEHPVHPGEALVEPLQRPAAQIHHTAADDHRPIAAIDGDAVTPGAYGRRDVLVLDDASGARRPFTPCHPAALPLRV